MGFNCTIVACAILRMRRAPRKRVLSTPRAARSAWLLAGNELPRFSQLAESGFLSFFATPFLVKTARGVRVALAALVSPRARPIAARWAARTCILHSLRGFANKIGVYKVAKGLNVVRTGLLWCGAGDDIWSDIDVLAAASF